MYKTCPKFGLVGLWENSTDARSEVCPESERVGARGRHKHE